MMLVGLGIVIGVALSVLAGIWFMDGGQHDQIYGVVTQTCSTCNGRGYRSVPPETPAAVSSHPWQEAPRYCVRCQALCAVTYLWEEDRFLCLTCRAIVP